MSLSWNEIRKRATKFAAEWKDETSESAEAKSYWDAFFEVFGISRRRLATFEKAVALLNDKTGKIDLFWRGLLLVEHKSAGKDLDSAFLQASRYFDGIPEADLPRYVVVSDFARIRLYDLDADKTTEFSLDQLPKKAKSFAFMLGQQHKQYDDESPVNIEAAEKMGLLHDALKANGYAGHKLEVLLVRLMFCLFADDTGIFEKDTFRWYIEEKTKKDGTDLGMHLAQLFQVLDEEPAKRQKNLDEDLLIFPYVNGGLFKERFDLPSFDSQSRELLVQCCKFAWEMVSPAVFGSMFQSVMDSEARKRLGAHYTSERNIMKTIQPLFLDRYEADFRDSYDDKKKLHALLGRIATSRVFDPACGCGNFLIVAYRELRKLELRIHKRIREIESKGALATQSFLGVDFGKGINVDAMYGIEIEEFPARIAETALWLVDHQMNMLASLEFGEYYTRLPLSTSPHIRLGNALAIDWKAFCPRTTNHYVLGNPPFVGKKRREEHQRADLAAICGHLKGYAVLDYVACWFVKARDYIDGTDIPVAFVATNSITQGEQVSVLWPSILTDDVHIEFAHRTFEWSNDSSGGAHVHVVVVGFTKRPRQSATLFDYGSPTADPVQLSASRINAYLVDAADVYISKRKTPLCDITPIRFGSMPNDGGHLLLDGAERAELIARDPKAKQFIKPILTAKEYIAGESRYCIWLADVPSAAWAKVKPIRERVEAVKVLRAASKREATRNLAATPQLFGEVRQPSGRYIVVPRHSAEGREYIPMGFASKTQIAGDSCATVQTGDLFVFGVLMSAMHVAWVRQVGGRIKSDLRYSNEIVYNNFPWPDGVSAARRKAIERSAKAVLAARDNYPDESLAGLYDPIAMPLDLRKAHRSLDREVDRCYSTKTLKTDLDRLRILFKAYTERVGGALLTPV